MCGLAVHPEFVNFTSLVFVSFTDFVVPMALYLAGRENYPDAFLVAIYHHPPKGDPKSGIRPSNHLKVTFRLPVSHLSMFLFVPNPPFRIPLLGTVLPELRKTASTQWKCESAVPRSIDNRHSNDHANANSDSDNDIRPC